MTDRYFPVLPENFVGTLTTLRAIILDDPSVLDDPACPYADDEKQLLLTAFNPLRQRQQPAFSDDATNDFDAPDQELSDEDVLESVEELFRQLKEFGQSMQSNSDPKDRAAYFRVATSLTDKIINQRERAQRLKDWNSFMSQLLAWLENVEPDLRTDLLDRIKDWT